MKKLLLVVGLVLLAGTALGATAAPEPNSDFEKLGDTLTVDSQYTARWELLDSVIVLKTDTCYTVHTIEGHVILDPGDRLYIGFIDGGGAPATTSTCVDTFVFYGAHGQKSPMVIPFKAVYLDSLIDQTDAADTIYFMGACGGTSTPEKIRLLDVFRTSLVIDNN